MIYRIFDIGVESDRPLTSLQQDQGVAPAVTVAFFERAFPDSGRFRQIHVWRSNTGEALMSCSQGPGGYLLEFPGGDQFHVDPENGEIRVYAASKKGSGRAVELLQDQVIPRLVAHRGRLVMHASAVVLQQEFAAIFFGDTGRGKSTLAAGFYQAGREILTDDCLLLERCGEGVCAIPAYRGLRLWPRSAEALGIDTMPRNVSEGEARKYRLAARKDGPPERPMPVSAFFIIGNQADAREQGDETVDIRRVQGMGELMQLVEAAFVLDPVSPGPARQNFEALGRVAACGIPVFSLNYPRRFELLPEVCRAIESAVESA